MIEKLNTTNTVEEETVVGKQNNPLEEVPKQETWEEHLETAKKAITEAQTNVHRVKLGVPKIIKPNGEIASHKLIKETYYSKFNRYPAQFENAKAMMQEAYREGRPLKVMNIGVSQGQEALEYVQRASEVAGVENIQNVLDLELVEYAKEIPLVQWSLGENITQESYNYLKNLYNTPKAHFGTAFQDHVKEAKEKGEKRDIILFNNVIQHLKYDGTPDERLQKCMSDIQNMSDVVADGGTLCMTCDPGPLAESSETRMRFESAKALLKQNGFTEITEGIFKKNQQHHQE